MSEPNLSAACGAWHNGHDTCTGLVALPPPQHRCDCPCHDTEASPTERALLMQLHGLA